MIAEAEIAVVFPGQGAQRPGMGRDFYEEISRCRRIYEEASEALGWDVAGICFGEDERLNQTAYTQPCILTTEVAMLEGLRERYGFSPTCFGGHSLGEYTALVAAGVMTLTCAAVIVNRRGQLMQEATPLGFGAMAAVISPGMDPLRIRETLADLPIDVANINSREQIAVSGMAQAMPEARERITEALGSAGGCRIVALNVSAPFHSRFMKPMEEEFRRLLDNESLEAGRACVVTSNFTGAFHSGGREDLVDCLVAQVSGAVRFRENMAVLARRAGRLYELGPSRVLKGFFTSDGLPCESITSLETARRNFEKGSQV